VTSREIGNKNVEGHGLHGFALKSPILILDSHVPFVEAAELKRSEVYVPDSIVDLLQPNVFADAYGGSGKD
jgi:hypothetical protein